MTKLFLVMFICLLPLGIMADSQAQQPDSTQTEQVQYDDMGDQLLTEFLIFNQRYMPQHVLRRCEVDPNWTLLGVNDMNGFRWVAVQVPGGIYSFGYTGETLQPQVVSFIPSTQYFIGKPVKEALKLLVSEAEIQFKRKADRVLGNSIIYNLTKPGEPDGISATIYVAPDGSYAIGTGFNKYIKVPDLEDA